MNVRGERIIVFGDSLSHHGSDSAPEIWDVDQGSNRASGQPGDLLASLLKEQGAEAVRVNARVSRSAPNFFSRENSQVLFNSDAQFLPTKVVVILGTNDLHINRGTDEEAMRKIVGFYQGLGAEVWGVGPFMYASSQLNTEAEPVVEMQKQIFGGRFIDPRPITAVVGRSSDGVHFGGEAARITALGLADLLMSTRAPGNWMPLAVGAAIVVGLGLFWSRWRQKRPALGSGARQPDQPRTPDDIDAPDRNPGDTAVREYYEAQRRKKKKKDLSGYRVAYGTSDGRKTFRAFDPNDFQTIEAASKRMRAYKRQGLWTWIEDDQGNFVPVTGARLEKVRKGYPLRGLGNSDVDEADDEDDDNRPRGLQPAHRKQAKKYVTEAKKALKQLKTASSKVDLSTEDLAKLSEDAHEKLLKAYDVINEDPEFQDAFDSGDDEVLEMVGAIEEARPPSGEDVKYESEAFLEEWASSMKRFEDNIANVEDYTRHTFGNHLGKLGARDDHPILTFRDLLLDPDPASMKIAEDLLLENELKLSKASSTFKNLGTEAGVFILNAGRSPSDNTEIGWRMWLDPDHRDQCTGEISTFVHGERVMWPMERKPGAAPEDRLELQYQGSKDFCVRATVADAWAVAKAVKTELHEARTGEGWTMPKIRNRIHKTINKDNSEPSELYGLAVSNVDVERIARDIEEEGKPDAAEMAATVRKQMTPYRRLGVFVKERGFKFQKSTLKAFATMCTPVSTRDRPAFCELRNLHKLADGSVLASIRSEPYSRDPGRSWIIHFEDVEQFKHYGREGAITDYRKHYSPESQKRKGRREPQ